MESPQTLYDKIWQSHVVHDYAADSVVSRSAPSADAPVLLYIDRHLVQEVSSPVAFEGLFERAIPLRRPDAHIAVADHAVSTMRSRPNPKNSQAAQQVARLVENTAATGMPYIPERDARQGIVHIIGPELGFTLPGCTLVCGDSHTSTHGAFGALAFGIGSSQCETVFATQCLQQTKQKNMRVSLCGTLQAGVYVKDVILALIAQIGTAGGRGYAIEFAGPAVDAMSMEARMTLCNMTIEAGSRIGLVAPDETTFAYLKGRPLAPSVRQWNDACDAWRRLKSDEHARFDHELQLDVSALEPQVSWGTNPAQTSAISACVPDPKDAPAEAAESIRDSLAYIGLQPGAAIAGTRIDRVFIGSCTNSRIEDLRAAAAVAAGRKVADKVHAMVVPGSQQVAAQAQGEGLDKIFLDAGFEWRAAGCSMCVAMNSDRLKPGERCASTTNRNFAGRQGRGGLTHLMSPAMAAAAAVTGSITDVRELVGL